MCTNSMTLVIVPIPVYLSDYGLQCNLKQARLEIQSSIRKLIQSSSLDHLVPVQFSIQSTPSFLFAKPLVISWLTTQDP